MVALLPRTASSRPSRSDQRAPHPTHALVPWLERLARLHLGVNQLDDQTRIIIDEIVSAANDASRRTQERNRELNRGLAIEI